MLQPILTEHWEAPVKQLTSRQAEVLRVLEKYIVREGIAPTFQELGDLLDMTAASARQHVLAIEHKGFLRRHPGKSRGLVLVTANGKHERRRK